MRRRADDLPADSGHILEDAAVQIIAANGVTRARYMLQRPALMRLERVALGRDVIRNVDQQPRIRHPGNVEIGSKEDGIELSLGAGHPGLVCIAGPDLARPLCRVTSAIPRSYICCHIGSLGSFWMKPIDSRSEPYKYRSGCEVRIQFVSAPAENCGRLW